MSEVILPEGWSNCTLADIAEVNPKKIEAEQDINAGFVPMSHAPTNYNGKLEFEEKTWGEISKSYTKFKNDDVIFAKVTPCFENGKAAIVKDMPNNIGAGSSEFYVLRARNQEIPASYLLGIIKTRKFMQEGAENMTGAVGLRRVPRAFVESFPLILPPLVEQKIIADKLDTLLAQVDSTKARLEQIPQILKRFRQAVLAAAVSGKLTEEWRISNGLKYWETQKIGNIVSQIESGKSLKCLETPPQEHEYGIVKISAVTWGEYNENESKTLPNKKDFIENRRVNDGDFLISRANTLELLGAPVIVHKATKNLMLSDKVLRLVMENEHKQWLSIFLRSSSGRKEIESRSTGNQLSMRNIGQKSLLDIDLPKPPIEEQHEIVRRVEKLFIYADTIEKQVQNALERVNNLTQSILAKAFRGELTAQWRATNPDLISGENSAQALLAKIQQQRTSTKTIKRRKGNS
ncbi:Type I restriction enzyme EcoKI specificity protein [Serratia fonticola]|uniref:restriction endonuclease subunit S n=1 Tax=Serratia fonticola TaxID=47917 RepID=UPI0021797724|nr:restriction endonuclease subunit S [Serratia fonticola]CAI1077122.1 Type I restriction enzyme EcoKI specificity protein [Serratia fonticola]